MAINSEVLVIAALKRELKLIALGGCALLLLEFAWLVQLGNGVLATLWLLLAALVWTYVVISAWPRLVQNRPYVAAPLYVNLGWANRLSIARGGLIALTAGFIGQAPELAHNLLLPAIFYSLPAALDRIDGFVARRSGRVSLLGNELDTRFDALGLLVAPLLAVYLGKLHTSFLLVSIAYYLFVWGLQWRRARNLACYPLMPNFLRRSLAGFQMGFVAFALWPIFPAPMTQLVGVAFTLPILLGFVVDWLVVSGRINAQLPHTQRGFQRLESISFNLLQPLLRVLLLIALGLLFFAQVFSAAGFYLALLGALLILSGCLGRLGALLLLATLGVQAVDTHANGSLRWAIYAAVFLSSWILLLGTGRFSLWNWDDRWVQRYDGAAQTPKAAITADEDLSR